MTNVHERWRDRTGQSLVEMAVVLPVLLLMVVGLIEFGRAWNISQVVTDAARQGARIAAVLDSDPSMTKPEATDSVTNVVLRVLASSNVPCNNSCIETPIEGILDGTNTAVTVEVAVPYNFMFFGPVMALAGQSFNNQSITLRSAAVMRNE